MGEHGNAGMTWCGDDFGAWKGRLIRGLAVWLHSNRGNVVQWPRWEKIYNCTQIEAPSRRLFVQALTSTARTCSALS